MTRGNQREQDRAKRQQKEASKNKGAGREGTPGQRNDNDKIALLAKLEAKKAEKAAETERAASGTKPAVVPKKVSKKKEENIDDLLGAGLAAKGKKSKK
jgi:hypothetical protein